MKNSIEFMILKMNELRSAFPYLDIIYDFNDETHIVNIDTNDLDKNHIYYDFISNLRGEFYNFYPDEDLIFISDEEDLNYFTISLNPKVNFKGNFKENTDKIFHNSKFILSDINAEFMKYLTGDKNSNDSKNNQYFYEKLENLKDYSYKEVPNLFREIESSKINNKENYAEAA